MAMSEILHLLRRPIAALKPSSEPNKSRKGAGPADPLPPVPVTEPELLTALNSVAAERAAAEDTITEASSRRERLLLDPTSDDLIFSAQRDLDGAQLKLERLDRIEPELHARLRAIRHAARRARWAQLRDDYIAGARRHAELAAALEASRGTWEAARDLVLAEYPGASAVLPAWPLPPVGAVAALPSALDRLAATGYDPDPAPAYIHRSVAAIAAEAANMGLDPQIPTAPELTLLLSREVAVRFPRPTRDAGGTFRDGGTELILPGPAARAEVQAGRATYVEEDFACR